MIHLLQRRPALAWLIIAAGILTFSLPNLYNVGQLSAQTFISPTPAPTPSVQPSPTPDLDEFDTRLITTYTVDQASITRVKHEFSITNRTPTTFIKQYALTTAYPDLTNVVVKDSGRAIEANVVSTNNQTSIAIVFPTDVVGEGKTRRFTIEYTNPDIALLGGNVLEIHAPELSDPEQYDEHTVKLITPISFGSPVRSNPEPDNTTISEAGIVTTFENLGGKSFSALYGDKQLYDLTLRYNLENLSSSEGFTQIALPPDTTFQQMYYHSLEPMPQDIKRDEDGNWIAKYHLPANSVTTVYLTAIARVTLEPQLNRNMPLPLKSHQSSDKFWEVKDSKVAAQAARFRTPEEIFNFVADALTYSDNIQGFPPRLGAAGALNKPEQAVCQEFTDLFIAMSRANNIPARRLTGYAHSQNESLRPRSFEGDVLHAWPEYYDTNRELWIQVDPTWASTTGGVDYFHQFDLNHIVFAINGTSSTTPYPAGSYKTAGADSKDVEVAFASSFPVGEPDFNLEFEPIRVLNLPLPGFYNLKVTNNTGHAWYDITAEFDHDASEINVNRGEHLNIPALLPFQTQTLTITAHTPTWKIVSNHPIIVKLTTQSENEHVSQTKNITAGPSFIGSFKNPQVLIGLGAGITFFTLVGGSVLVFRRT